MSEQQNTSLVEFVGIVKTIQSQKFQLAVVLYLINFKTIIG